MAEDAQPQTQRNPLGGPTVVVIIPCYNEELTIGKVVSDFARELPQATIYVYDNNSTDNTAEIARSAGAVVRHESRQGKGNVVRSMLRDIEADCYVMVDGDDTYPAEMAPAMVAMVLDEGYDMVDGDRLSTTYFVENKRPFHNFGNKLVRGLINLLFDSHIHDVMTGYRAMGFGFAKTLPVLSHGFELETEMTIHALDKNLKIREVPVEYRDRPEGSTSKLNTFKDGFKVIGAIVNLVREYRPLLFFSVIGILLIAAGILLALPVAHELLDTHDIRHPSNLFAGFLGIMLGTTSIIAGFIISDSAKRSRKDFEIRMNEMKLVHHLLGTPRSDARDWGEDA